MIRNDFPSKITYMSALSIEECISSILNRPHEYNVEFSSSAFYEAEFVSAGRLLVAFTGGQFNKAHRTQYAVDFDEETSQTRITFTFLHETLNSPPATLLSWIDAFMEQKTAAVRVQWEQHNSDLPNVEQYSSQSTDKSLMIGICLITAFLILAAWLLFLS